MGGRGEDDDDDGDGDDVMLTLPPSKVETMRENGSGRSWEEKAGVTLEAHGGDF